MSEKFNFNKSIKDKEMKIMNYYRRNMSKQPMIVEKPIKKRKLTQKHITKHLAGGADENGIQNNKEYKTEKNKKEDNKLTTLNKTKKQIVIMDD